MKAREAEAFWDVKTIPLTADDPLVTILGTAESL